MPRNLFAALLVSACLALLLSFVPSVRWHGSVTDVPAFQSQKPIVLNQQNLVDLFTLARTHYNIKRVKWENGSLYVDFSLTASDSADVKALYQDTYEVAYRAFQFTRNVQHLFFRLLETQADQSSRLLVAIQADRPQAGVIFPAPDRVDDIQAFVERLFIVRFEPGFAERIRPT